MILDVIEYTDPYCTWCWGSEPILRKIQEVYGEQVRIGFRMGGLVKDIGQFFDPANRIGGKDWYKQVAEHWLEASSRHGMPVDPEIFFDIKDEVFSTYPANIAYKSAEMQDERLAKRFLRRMREAASAERRAIHRLDMQADLAEEVGLDRDRFLEDINNGQAEGAFKKDLAECRSMGVSGFPTFLIRNQKGERILLHGYVSFGSFEAAFTKLADDTLKPRTIVLTEQTVLDLVRRYGKVAPREVGEVFDITMEAATGRLELLRERGLLAEQKAGNGVFYSVPEDLEE
ncbi:MAG: DsbA family protein [Candidatus Undinarchaeales archaeon]|jgi:predicted DsbA family dithiol-disulfide isomerase|nr:DsbA family protein [Candidatus Undinarchaeales archaeon]MDP7492736.1 DsbA family protein [Candidatus Undinarchaeales archaeon]